MGRSISPMTRERSAYEAHRLASSHQWPDHCERKIAEPRSPSLYDRPRQHVADGERSGIKRKRIGEPQEDSRRPGSAKDVHTKKGQSVAVQRYGTLNRSHSSTAPASKHALRGKGEPSSLRSSDKDLGARALPKTRLSFGDDLEDASDAEAAGTFSLSASTSLRSATAQYCLLSCAPGIRRSHLSRRTQYVLPKQPSKCLQRENYPAMAEAEMLFHNSIRVNLCLATLINKPCLARMTKHSQQTEACCEAHTHHAVSWQDWPPR